MDPDFPNNNQPAQPQPPQQTYQPEQPVGPDSQSQPSQPAGQGSYGGGDFGAPGTDNKTKKLIIVIAALVVLFIIIAIVALAFSSGGNEPNNQSQEEVSGAFYVKEPTAVDVESVNNSISDDISGLDTDADFPEDALNDQSLGL
jgi:preprotein translocase subunit SecG